MEILTEKELLSIRGGGISLGAITFIGAAITFVVGIIDGISRPLRCNLVIKRW